MCGSIVTPEGWHASLSWCIFRQVGKKEEDKSGVYLVGQGGVFDYNPPPVCGSATDKNTCRTGSGCAMVIVLAMSHQ